MIFSRFAAASLAALLLPPAAQEPTAAPALPLLAAPFVVAADGAPIAATTGHAAPFLVDLNRDGRPDLVVGEFGESGGRARIYLNEGTAAAPKFGGFQFLQAAGQDASVPSS